MPEPSQGPPKALAVVNLFLLFSSGRAYSLLCVQNYILGLCPIGSHLDPQPLGACGCLSVHPAAVCSLLALVAEWLLLLGLAGFSMASLLYHPTPRLISWPQTSSFAFRNILSGNPNFISQRR